MRTQLLYWSVCLCFCYLVAEGVFSALYIHGWVLPPDSVMLFEDSGKTVHFDPILGFRYTPDRSRSARLSHGRVEFLTEFWGNNLGFQERDSVLPTPAPGISRLAVLGDSFTAAEHLEYNWPDRLERSVVFAGQLELANFSLSGAGLANWWSIVQRLWKPGGYQFDGVIFAVFEGNLHRSFSMADHRGVSRHRFGRTPGWDPAHWPTTLEEAQAHMQTLRGYILAPAEFEAALAGDWHPELPRALGFHGWQLIQQRLTEWRTPPTIPPATTPEPVFTPGQQALIADLHAYFQQHRLPVLVVRIPSREGLIAGIKPALDAEAFANLLGAHYVDGAAAFSGLDETAIRAHWLPVDGHWNQQGSDRFVGFMQESLTLWPENEDILYK